MIHCVVIVLVLKLYLYYVMCSDCISLEINVLCIYVV